jgi:hypothetical protein
VGASDSVCGRECRNGDGRVAGCHCARSCTAQAMMSAPQSRLQPVTFPLLTFAPQNNDELRSTPILWLPRLLAGVGWQLSEVDWTCMKKDGRRQRGGRAGWVPPVNQDWTERVGRDRVTDGIHASARRQALQREEEQSTTREGRTATDRQGPEGTGAPGRLSKHETGRRGRRRRLTEPGEGSKAATMTENPAASRGSEGPATR